ncbi:MAG: long-chain fatty acid--CoA ligase [Betaproteobacteria bacterium]|nr:long-chain fatty acid--CoA ligase [Betaproteobacteria bacterium]
MSLAEREKQYVTVGEADSIATAFARRVALSPEAVAYREFDMSTQDWTRYSWAETARMARRVCAGLAAEGLGPGERVAIMLSNCKEWVWFDQGAFAGGLVTVPVYVNDRPDNIAYCLNDAGVKLLVVEGEEHLKRLAEVRARMPEVTRIITIKSVAQSGDRSVRALADWLPADAAAEPPVAVDGNALATIVYTSGTTGRPKGVMLSHQNMLQNALSGLGGIDVYTDDVFLSFLPLSHMFERTVGCYLTMLAGSEVAFARSIPQLAEDFRSVRPTVIVSVPRIYERLHATIQGQLQAASGLKRHLFDFAGRTGWSLFEWRQGRGPWKPSFVLWPVLRALVASKLLARLGGRLRIAVSGGAALNPQIARTFIGLGLPICQGYGLTEASPVVSVNRLENNDPASVGAPLSGIEIAFGANDALLVRGPSVMLGYWNNPDATASVKNAEGWLDTGDQAKLENGLLYITGRIKEIIVLANGEKVPPVDMELAIQLDPLLEQVLVVGEGKPFLGALVALNMDEWSRLAEATSLGADPNGEGRERAEKLVLSRVAKQVRDFPGYAQVRRVALLTDKWTVDNGLLTPTLKPKRNLILDRYRDRYADIYRGHAG